MAPAIELLDITVSKTSSILPERLILPWIIEMDRKLMSRGLISYRRLVSSCSKMALDGSIIVEICDETMAKMWRKPVEM